MKYSIVIPVYKEEKNISKLINILNYTLKNARKKYEIIFIDDDSNDNSKKIFNKYKSKNNRFYIRKKKPRDLSKSVIYGFEKAKFNNLVVMDGDLQHRPKDLLKLMRIYEKKNDDIVFGSRKLINHKEANLNPLRFYASKLLNFFTNFIFRLKFKDPMSGFFIIKKKVYIKCNNKLFLVGYKILLDIIISSSKNIKIEEVFISFKSREKGFSKMRFKILLQLFSFLLFKFFYRLI